MNWSDDLFGCCPSVLPIAGKPRSVWQRDELLRAESSGSGLWMAPDVVVSAGFVRALSRRAAELQGPVRAAVAVGEIHAEFGPNSLGEVGVHDGALHYDLVVGPEGVVDPAGMADPEGVVDPAGVLGPAGAVEQEVVAQPVMIDQLSVAGRSPQPGRMASPITSFAGDRFIWSIGHWYDLLVVNLLAVQTGTGLLDGNSIADTAVVHPTAVIENSVIGEHATIGPFAVVRNSRVGDRCQVDEYVSIRGSLLAEDCMIQTQSLVHGSTVGPRTVVSFQTAIRGSVLFGHSTISAAVVARSVIGPEVFLARTVSISATTLTDQPVSVRDGAKSSSTGAHLVGCAVGRGARIGNGIAIPAGYTVPAAAYLAERPIPRLSPETPDRSPLILDGGRFRSFPTLKGPTT